MASSVLAAFLAFPLGFVSDTLPLIAGLPSYLGLSYVIHVATLSSSLPFASVIIPAFPFWIVCASYIALGLIVFHNKKRSREGVNVSR
jgi:hypothetical protein